MRSSSRTASLNGVVYDIDKLYILVRGRSPSRIPLPRISRSPRTGFSKTRYANAHRNCDPILVDGKGRIWDGRHRVARLEDAGLTTVFAITVTDEELESARIEAANPSSDLW